MLFLLRQAEKQIDLTETHSILLKSHQCGGKYSKQNKNMTDSGLDINF